MMPNCFILKSSIALGNLDRINQELLLVYLDPEFEIATNFSEKEIQSDITFYLSKVLSINFKEQHLPKKYYFYDLNNNYDLEKRLKAKEEYVKSGLIPFSQMLDELTETYYDLDIVNQLEFLNSNRDFSPKNKYEAENLQKLILYLSYEFDEPDLLIPFLKFFSKNMERAHKISPVEKATELFNLSYLMGESWLPISLKGINKHPDLVFAKNIKSKVFIA